jgi:glycine cleavage system aminomethyltransferase T
VIDPALAEMSFMTVKRYDAFGRITVTRSGYTGEDGYEILVRAENATDLANALLAHPEVKPIGLARGIRCASKRGFAFMATISIRRRRRSKPISLGPSRSAAAKRKTFRAPSASCASTNSAPKRKRVGIRPNDRAPAREGVEIQGRQDDWRRHLRRLLADPEWPDLDGLRRRRPRRTGDTSSISSSAATPRRPPSCRCRSCRTNITARRRELRNP